MQLEYLAVYLEILAICFIFTLVILINVRNDLGGDLEVDTFKWILRVMLIALVFDALTHAHYRGAVHFPRAFLGFLYATYMFLFSGVLSFLWLQFCELRLGIRGEKLKKIRIIGLIPVFIIGILAYGSIIFGWFFVIDEYSIYHRGPYWTHQSIVSYIYFFFTSIQSIYYARKERAPQKRHQYYVLAAFVIAPVIGALLQIFIGGHPFVAPATCVAIFFIFIGLQRNMISHDALTGINNREGFNQYLTEAIMKADTSPIYVYSMGIKDFKKINDVHGRMEGDKALQIVANVLKDTIEEYFGVIGRLGGGEFTVFIEKQYLNKPEEFITDFNNNLAKKCEGMNLPYELACNVGYISCEKNDAKCNDLIIEATKVMNRSIK